MQTERDASFVLATPESEPLDAPEESALDKCQEGATPPQVTSVSLAPGDIRITSPSDVAVATPGDMRITPLVTPMSPQENNNKRTNDRGKVPVTFSKTVPTRAPETTASPPPRDLSDTTKIVLERRIGELRKEIATAARKDLHERAVQLHTELAAHQTKLGFTPDDLPRGAPPPARKASESYVRQVQQKGDQVRAGKRVRLFINARQGEVAAAGAPVGKELRRWRPARATGL